MNIIYSWVLGMLTSFQDNFNMEEEDKRDLLKDI